MYIKIPVFVFGDSFCPGLPVGSIMLGKYSVFPSLVNVDIVLFLPGFAPSYMLDEKYHRKHSALSFKHP